MRDREVRDREVRDREVRDREVRDREVRDREVARDVHKSFQCVYCVRTYVIYQQFPSSQEIKAFSLE